MSLLRQAVKSILPPGLLVLLVLSKYRFNRKWKSASSFLDEENIIKKYLDYLQLKNNYCVDIAASDGISSSNTYSLFKSGWDGIAVELDSTKFAMLAIIYRRFPNVNLIKTKIIPDNISSILKSCMCPKDFSLLNLDIDGYDFFVLDKLLNDFRPSLICVEINENIPPPIQFTVKYDINHMWSGDHFHGQSLSKCYELCKKYNYEILELHYNNLFIIPQELNKSEPLSPERAYDIGYRNRVDRKVKFPWNSDMEDLLTMTREDAIRFLYKKFDKYNGKFIVE